MTFKLSHVSELWCALIFIASFSHAQSQQPEVYFEDFDDGSVSTPLQLLGSAWMTPDGSGGKYAEIMVEEFPDYYLFGITNQSEYDSFLVDFTFFDPDFGFSSGQGYCANTYFGYDFNSIQSYGPVVVETFYTSIIEDVVSCEKTDPNTQAYGLTLKKYGTQQALITQNVAAYKTVYAPGVIYPAVSDFEMEVACACEGSYPDDEQEAQNCMNFLSFHVQDYRLGMDDVQVTAYRQNVINGLEDAIDESKTLLFYSDLMGRTVQSPASGWYLSHYSDGSTEKIYRP